MGRILAILVGGLIGLGASTFLYGKGFSYLSNDPRACVNCHIMNDQYDGWLKSSHHSVAACNDCHLPHRLIPKLAIKAENGFWHSKGFTLQDFAEPIRIRRHNRQLLNRNCQECHHELVGDVVAAQGHDDTRFDCIRCHIASGHGPER